MSPGSVLLAVPVANDAVVSADVPAVCSTFTTASAGTVVSELRPVVDNNVSLASSHWSAVVSSTVDSSAVQTGGGLAHRYRLLLQTPRHRRQPHRTHRRDRLRTLQPLP